jgi:hypothetical protein
MSWWRPQGAILVARHGVPVHHVASTRADLEASMTRQAILDKLQAVVIATFLGAGPALGAVIVLAWLTGLVLGLFGVIRR